MGLSGFGKRSLVDFEKHYGKVGSRLTTNKSVSGQWVAGRGGIGPIIK